MSREVGRSPLRGSGSRPSGRAKRVVSPAVAASILNAIADKLDEARALIEKGWCQGNFMKQTPFETRHCADGALMSVDLGEDYCLARILLSRVIGQPVWDWNDAKGRTQAEVIEAFRKAAELARAEAQ